MRPLAISSLRVGPAACGLLKFAMRAASAERALWPWNAIAVR
jgi:hypothetical protein